MCMHVYMCAMHDDEAYLRSQSVQRAGPRVHRRILSGHATDIEDQEERTPFFGSTLFVVCLDILI